MKRNLFFVCYPIVGLRMSADQAKSKILFFGYLDRRISGGYPPVDHTQKNILYIFRYEPQNDVWVHSKHVKMSSSTFGAPLSLLQLILSRWGGRKVVNVTM